MADKPNRKGLMSLLTEYSNEKYYGKSGQRGMTKDGDSKADIAEARKRQAKVKAQAAKKKEEKKKNNPPKTTSSSSSSRSSSSPTRSSSSSSSSTPARARQQASTTRAGRGSGITGNGYTGGRGGKPTPPQTRNVYNRRGRKVGEKVVLPPSEKPKRKFNRRGREIK